MSSEAIQLAVANHIAIVTIDRPDVRNAIDRPTALALEKAIDDAESDPDVRVIVLAGSGSVFCAGMDLKAFSATGERPITDRRGAFGIVEVPPTKPTIAAVEGKALGGGFEIALAADLIVAADTAMFGLPEVKRGLVAAAGGLLRLPRRVPRNVALHMTLTGEPITAIQAQALGLVTDVVAEGTATKAALDLAATIAANAPLAVRASKQIITESDDWTVSDMFERQGRITSVVRSSCDAAEGARAFVEKRSPVWSGK
ncbi:crotonase/enoyl-CoA hydratase family protein [Rhodococcus opacus]|uniref:crotonase/enoyl-CoA hydratase family protein n=1 Tax=Rhodococcus opacus TaxID=37919 RepID=UPI002474D5A3|nr:crotonase/enoyl-CoA hydratase family protein [Rhodococcus opacus]MDH6291268.1 enoyl-CoA hydratase/carnithine racemase [Rhodococcus opacus]